MIRRKTSRRARRALVLSAISAAVVATCAIVTVADAATPPHVPFGHIDALQQNSTGFHIRGWALDPDSRDPIRLHIKVNGAIAKAVTANTTRTDIDRIYGLGSAHGFVADIPEPAGKYDVCVYAINVGAGTVNPQIGCRSITLNFDPTGQMVTVKQFPGGFTASGWAVDPSSPTATVKVNLLVDGSHTPDVSASTARTDIPSFLPSAGSNHGWTIKQYASEGVHHVCLYAINVGTGSNATMACRDLTLNYSPVGAITALSQRPGGFNISGWAIDPDTSSPVTVTVAADGATVGTAVADQAATGHGNHGFTGAFKLPGSLLPPGVRTICVTATNLGTYGKDRTFTCKAINLNYNPTAAVLTLTQKSPGALITGWTSDPDTSAVTQVTITADGNTITTVAADLAGSVHNGHNFSVLVPLPNGTHQVCATALNRYYGNGPSAPACKSVTLNFNPFGGFDSVVRALDGTSLKITGWAIDPDTTGQIPIKVVVDGVTQSPLSHTGTSRPDIASKYPGTGSTQGYYVAYKATDQEHKVCITAVNVLGGTGDTSLGCRIINAVHPVPPSAPQNVTAVPGYGEAKVSWSRPASDGGAPWSKYIITASPGGASHAVNGAATTTTITGLAQKTTYTFSVVAVNVAGTSPAGKSPAVTTLVGPPPQTTPAPISTSRYIRNITGATSTDLSFMRAAGAADATANPSGHRYLMLLDIGGQDQTRGGVLLSATTRFISYPNLVTDIKAYIDGYASKQRATAPATIAIGTNNDVDVSGTAGAQWATAVINPLRTYAAKYTGIGIAGANDIEPGFRGTYLATKAWLGGFLQNTGAQWVNNGSADGCSWTVANSGCNNGWTMSGLYFLSMGAAPTRSVTLPQIYNSAMSGQWKYISLTGLAQSRPRINFGGPLTEWTACSQAGSCGSLTGNEAWTQMWNALQSNTALRVPSLPFSTDLRIDR